MKKTEAEFLHDIDNAITRVVGKKVVTSQTYLKRDLEIQSIDLVDILFELENITGLDTRPGKVMLISIGQESRGMDLQIGQLISYLSELSSRK